MLAIPYSLFVGIVAEPISVELHGGAYALFEVKMGAWEIDDGAASLLKLARKVDASVMGPRILRRHHPGRVRLPPRGRGPRDSHHLSCPMTLRPPWHASP